MEKKKKAQSNNVTTVKTASQKANSKTGSPKRRTKKKTRLPLKTLRQSLLDDYRHALDKSDLNDFEKNDFARDFEARLDKWIHKTGIEKASDILDKKPTQDLLQMISCFELFPSFKRSDSPSISVQKKKLLFVLSGGAAKGSFQAGALHFFERRLGGSPAGSSRSTRRADIVGVYGTSVGAINALGISESGWDGINKVVDIWFGLRKNSDMYLPEPWLNDIMHSLGISINFSSGSPSIDLGVLEDIISGIRSEISVLWELITTDLTDRLGDALEKLNKAESFFNLEPVADILYNKIDFDRLDIPMRLCMVGMRSGHVWYATEDNRLVQSTGATSPVGITWSIDNSPDQNITQPYQHPLIAAALGSAAIPLIFRPSCLENTSANLLTRLQGDATDFFYDGGIREILPIEQVESFGAELIVSITTQKPSLMYTLWDYRKGNALMTDPNAIAQTAGSAPRLFDCYARALDVMMNEIGEREFELAAANNEDQERLVIYPSIDVHSSYTISPGLIRISAAHGYMRAYDLYYVYENGGGDSNRWANDVGGFQLPDSGPLAGAIRHHNIISDRKIAYRLEERIIDRVFRNGRLLGFASSMREILELREIKSRICRCVDLRVEAFDGDLEFVLTLCQVRSN